VSFKQTLIFAVILILLAGYIVYLQVTKPEEKYEAPPEVWSVKEEAIEHITVRLPREDKQISFFLDKKEDKWRFDDEKKHPVDLKRWGGIVLLVSGPQSKKILAQKVEDLVEFGLADPRMIITLGVQGLKDPLDIVFGNRTPHKDNFYVKLRHSDPVYLINDTFCEVLMRLATEPPIPPLIKARAKAKEQ
jgi:hypothetical protein